MNKILEQNNEKYREFIKCTNDPFYFITKYCRVLTYDKDGKMVRSTPLTLTENQKQFVKYLLDKKTFIASSPRQCGLTSGVEWVLSYFLLFGEESAKITYITHNTEALKPVREHISRTINDFLTDEDYAYVNNSNELKYKGVTINFMSGRSTQSVSFYDPDFVIVDNADFIPKENLDRWVDYCFEKDKAIAMFSSPNNGRYKEGGGMEKYIKDPRFCIRYIPFIYSDCLNNRIKNAFDVERYGNNKDDWQKICSIWPNTKDFITEMFGLFL